MNHKCDAKRGAQIRIKESQRGPYHPHHMAESYRTPLIYVLATCGDLALVYLPTLATVPALHPTGAIPDNSRRLLVRRLLPLQGFDLRLPVRPPWPGAGLSAWPWLTSPRRLSAISPLTMTSGKSAAAAGGGNMEGVSVRGAEGASQGEPCYEELNTALGHNGLMI